MDKQEFLKELNSRCEYNKYNHIQVTDVGPDYAVVEAELRPESLNPLGMAHGGFVYSMCDVAAGSVTVARANKFVTLSSSMYFMHPSMGKRLRCEGKIIKFGRTVNVVETSVYDDKGGLTAKGTFEIYILEPKEDS